MKNCNLFLYQLQRHSDHHANPTRRFQALRHFDDSPQLPSGYASMLIPAYLPFVWYQKMDPLGLVALKMKKIVFYWFWDWGLFTTFSFPLAVVTVSLADPWTLQHLKRDHKALLACSTPAISDWYIWIRDFVIYSTSSHSKEREKK